MRQFVALVVVLAAAVSVSAQQAPKDARLGKPTDYDGHYDPADGSRKTFAWTAPASKTAWDARREKVRTQMLVANGLWPMPEKTPLHAVIHGKIERDGYTIEKVFFASYPGHYVCGNLYRPAPAADPSKPVGKHPAVLCPHGHWANGRFLLQNDATIAGDKNRGAE